MFHIYHYQIDATDFANSLKIGDPDAKDPLAILLAEPPSVVAFLYIKYISQEKGFGVFSGENIPRIPDAFGPVCLGSYGGMVCGSEREALHSKATYNMSTAHLTRDAEPQRQQELAGLTHEERIQIAEERCVVQAYNE